MHGKTLEYKRCLRININLNGMQQEVLNESCFFTHWKNIQHLTFNNLKIKTKLFYKYHELIVKTSNNFK